MQRENRKVSFNAKRKLLLGSTCCNCGKECGTKIEYHHIVPLNHGGNDIISNLAPLCPECHSMCTFGFVKNTERIGRKRRVYDPALLDSVFKQYVNGEITERRAKELLETGSHIRDMVQFKEWAEENKIDFTKNFGRSGRWYK